MDIVAAYEQVGTYRGAAALCGTTHKTVKRVIEARRVGGSFDARRRQLPKNTDAVVTVIAEKVQATDGRISAKRLLPVARAAGYAGSARNFRRAVAEAKKSWRRRRRVYRPWQPTPGEHLVIDWMTEGGWQVFCAVAPWSRWRFVRMATDQKAATTMALLAECFEELGGVTQVVLADRMGCLKGGVVANVVVPTADYVRFATHFGFRPDFCEAADPESKGVVEALCRYAQSDLAVPAGGWVDAAEANAAARAWCTEVNANVHSEIAAVPNDRLLEERKVLRPLPSLRSPLQRGEARKVDKLATVRFGSARYSVPKELVGRSVEVISAEGEIRIHDCGELVASHPLVGRVSAPSSTSTTGDRGERRPEPSARSPAPSGRSWPWARRPRRSCERLPPPGPTSWAPSSPSSLDSKRRGDERPWWPPSNGQRRSAASGPAMFAPSSRPAQAWPPS